MDKHGQDKTKVSIQHQPYSDHASLVWLKNYKDADALLAHWLMKLEKCNFKTVHRTGKAHGNADGISRCHICYNPRCVVIVPRVVPSDSEPSPTVWMVCKRVRRAKHKAHSVSYTDHSGMDTMTESTTTTLN